MYSRVKNGFYFQCNFISQPLKVFNVHVFEWRRSREEGERPYILPFLFRGVTRMYHTYMYIPLSKEQGELSNHSLLRGVRGSDSALFAGQTICIRV